MRDNISSGSQVKLTRITVNHLHKDSGLSEIVTNESSVIINPQPGEVDFERITNMAAPVYTVDQVLKSSPAAVVTTEGYLLINKDEPVDQNCRDGMSKRMLD